VNGELVVFYSGKEQVGGGLYWQIDVKIVETSASPWRQYVVQDWKATAQSFWLFKDIRQVTAVFYIRYQNDLLIASKNENICLKFKEYTNWGSLSGCPLEMSKC